MPPRLVHNAQQAMNHFLENWGSIVGVLGLIVGIVGVGFSIAAFHRAGKARDAAEAAEAASRETRASMTRTLTSVDLERAIALVQRLNELHRDGRWEVSIALYPMLMTMLSDISSRHPVPTPELQQQLQGAMLQITEMNNDVDAAIRDVSEPSELQTFNRILSNIQVNLLNISGSIQFSHEWNE